MAAPIIQWTVIAALLLTSAMNIFATVKLNGMTNRLTDLFCMENDR